MKKAHICLEVPPKMIPAVSSRGEKYVKSTPDSWKHDDLMDLPENKEGQPMPKNYHVTKRPDGKWQTIGEGNRRATHVTNTQEEARLKARDLAIKNHSEVLIHGVNGKIRARDSYGNDPCPPRG